MVVVVDYLRLSRNIATMLQGNIAATLRAIRVIILYIF